MIDTTDEARVMRQIREHNNYDGITFNTLHWLTSTAEGRGIPSITLQGMLNTLIARGTVRVRIDSDSVLWYHLA